MKTLIPLVLLPLVCLAAPADESVPQPLTTLNFRGEELPVYAPPRAIQPTKSVPPRFPGNEPAASLYGQAEIILLVGTDGKVAEVDVLSSRPTAAFGDAARTAARQWRFEPQLRDGRPTKFIVQQTVTFNVKSSPRMAQGVTMPMVPDRYPYYEGFGRIP